ncbi:MAG TPA: HEAT repeat domain-containing protein [Gemmatales bacterium]|nr:HEAT repeat domain-containing protein [Gemmatales bacterium]
MASYRGSVGAGLMIGVLYGIPCSAQSEVPVGSFVIPLAPAKAETQPVGEWAKQTIALVDSIWTESNEAKRQKKLFDWAEQTPGQLAYVTRILSKNDEQQTGKVVVTLKDLFDIMRRVTWQPGDQPYVQRIVATWSASVPQLVKNITGANLSAGQRRNLEQALVDLVLISKDTQISTPVMKHTWLAQVSSLAQLVGHPKTSVRLTALSILEALGTDAVPAGQLVQQALSDPDRFVRWAAVRALAAIGIDDSSRQMLATMEKDEDANVRQAVQLAMQTPAARTESVAQAGRPTLDLTVPAPPPVTPSTPSTVIDKNINVPASTDGATERQPAELLPPPTPVKPAAPAQLPAAMSPVPLQLPATKVDPKNNPIPLFAPPPATQAPVKQVPSRLITENKIIQPAAVVSLVKPEPMADPASLWIPRLRQGTVDQQVQAVRELGKLGSGAASAVPTLAECLLKGNVAVRREIPLTLMKIGATARLATSVLERSLQDSDIDVKVNAARALLELAE